MALFSYQIPGWEKYNPRKERATHSWFRFQKDFFTGQDGFLMTPEQKLLFILLCCERCGKNTDLVTIRTEYITALIHINEQSVINNITRLHALKMIVLDGESQILAPAVHQLPPSGPLRTNERTNERTGATAPDQPPLFNQEEHQKPTISVLPKIAELWNQHVTEELPRVTRCGAARKKKLEKAWKTEPRETFWIQAFVNVNESKFLTGKTKPLPGRKPFKADLDWLVEGENLDKVLEGKYTDEDGRADTPHPMAAEINGMTSGS